MMSFKPPVAGWSGHAQTTVEMMQENLGEKCLHQHSYLGLKVKYKPSV